MPSKNNAVQELSVEPSIDCEYQVKGGAAQDEPQQEVSVTTFSSSPSVSRSNSIHDVTDKKMTTPLKNIHCLTMNNVDREVEEVSDADHTQTEKSEVTTAEAVQQDTLTVNEEETCEKETRPPLSPQQVTSNNQALIQRPHSDLAVRITNLTKASVMSLDLAGLATKVVLETAKMSTRAGLGIAKVVTGVMVSDRSRGNVENDRFFIPRIVGDATAFLLHRTLTLTEQIALAGLEFTSETVSYTLSTVADSISVVDTLFGSTDTAKAVAEFVQLVKREWSTSLEEGEEDVGSFGAFRVIKVLTAWACLQYVTGTRWETEMGGWKRVKLVDIRDLLDDWVEINHEDSITYEELECLIEEDEEDEEMVVVSSKSDDLVVGELQPREDLSDHLSVLHNRNSKRLSDLYVVESTKRFSNPYMEKTVVQSEEEKLYTLLHNLKRYSKFSSTTYNVKTAIMNQLPFQRHRTQQHRVTFARQNELPLESIVHSSHQNPPSSNNHYAPTYYLIRDPSTKSIILALRGTMSIHDLIVDLSCEYVDFQLPEDIQRGDLRKHQVHKGMLEVAKALANPDESGVFNALKREMELNEDYGLILVGHSLGAGVASLLALLLASPTTRMTTRWSKLPLGRRVHAYAFATPCVMSAELSKRSKELVTSIAYGNDVICRLSIGHIRDLRNMVSFLGSKTDPESGQDLTTSIITKVLDYHSRTFNDNEQGRAERKQFEDYFWNMRQEVHTRMQANKLYPAGQLYWTVGKDRVPYCDASYDDEAGEETHNAHENGYTRDHKYNVVEVQNVEKIFEEIWFSPTMLMDHLPNIYENVLKSL